ncbi:MAG: WYL domain-containing protein, partial [Bacteroidia bacterium]
MNKAIRYALASAVLHHSVCKVKISTEPQTRNIHPYGLCVNKDGDFHLVCWQEGGHSASGELPNFRTIPMEEVESLEITTETFDVSEHFYPDHKMYHSWEFHVS